MPPFALTGGHLGALERPLVSAKGECGPSLPFALTAPAFRCPFPPPRDREGRPHTRRAHREVKTPYPAQRW